MLTALTLSGSSSHSLARTCLGTSTRLASMSGGPRLASMSWHERCRVSCTTHGPACQFMNTSHTVSCQHVLEEIGNHQAVHMSWLEVSSMSAGWPSPPSPFRFLDGPSSPPCLIGSFAPFSPVFSLLSSLASLHTSVRFLHWFALVFQGLSSQIVVHSEVDTGR